MRRSARPGTGPRAALASLVLLLAACCPPAAAPEGGDAATAELALRATLRSADGRVVAWPLGGGAPIVLEDPAGILGRDWDGRTAYLRLRAARAGGAPRVVVAAAPVATEG